MAKIICTTRNSQLICFAFFWLCCFWLSCCLVKIAYQAFIHSDNWCVHLILRGIVSFPRFACRDGASNGCWTIGQWISNYVITWFCFVACVSSAFFLSLSLDPVCTKRGKNENAMKWKTVPQTVYSFLCTPPQPERSVVPADTLHRWTIAAVWCWACSSAT